MGIDLILHSNNISSESTLQRPKWNVDDRIPSGKLSIKSFNYENHPNTDWVLMDHIPAQTGSTSWFARDDALGYTGVSATAIGAISDLTQNFRRAGTFEQAVPGYNQIKIQTVNTNFEGTTDRAYWVFSKETRDKFGKQSQAGENGTLVVGGDSTFLFNKFPLIDSWDFNSSDQAKSFYVDPSNLSVEQFNWNSEPVDYKLRIFADQVGNLLYDDKGSVLGGAVVDFAPQGPVTAGNVGKSVGVSGVASDIIKLLGHDGAVNDLSPQGGDGSWINTNYVAPVDNYGTFTWTLLLKINPGDTAVLAQYNTNNNIVPDSETTIIGNYRHSPSETGAPFIAMWINDVGNIRISERNPSLTTAQYVTSVQIDDGLWHRLSFVSTSTNGILYIDGVENGSYTKVGGILTDIEDGTTNKLPVIINGALNRYWQGEISDVRLYERALSATEVSTLGSTPENFIPSTPASGPGPSPLVVSHQHLDGNIQCFYLEAGNSGIANTNNSVGNLLGYGMQIFIRRYVPVYNPYAIIYQNVGARDYRPGDIQNKTPVKFMYFQLFNPSHLASSFDITEVRLLNTAQNNVLQDSSILVPTDGLNSLAVETNPSCTNIKSGDTLADIIDNSILSNAVIGVINDDIDEIIQFKLNREYTFDEFSRLEVYFNNENGPSEIRFLDAKYELVHNSVFYTSKPTFTGTDESLIILKFLGPPNVMEGFTNSVNDDVVVYVYDWADELVLTSSYIYRKELEIPFNLGVGGTPARIKRPIQPTSIGAIISNKDSPYTNFNIPSNDGDHGWKLIDHLPPGENRWFKRVDDFGFLTSVPPTAEGSLSDLSNRFTRGGTMESICPGYDQLMLKTVNTYDGAFEHTAGDLYYIFSRTERDRVMALNGVNTTIAMLASYDGKNVFVQQYTSVGGARPFISFPNFSINRCIYQEAHAGDIPDKMLTYGLQIWIRNSKSGNVTTKGSCVPIRPLDGILWHNNGEIEFSLEKLSTSEQINNDETPKDYSLHCHICTCSRGP